MTNAPITPGTQPQQVSNKTINTEPQPLSITAKGGKKIAKITRKQDMIFVFLDRSLRYLSHSNTGDGTFATRKDTLLTR